MSTVMILYGSSEGHTALIAACMAEVTRGEGISVSLAVADGTAKGREEANRYVEEFFRQTGWRAGKVGLFAGALLYTRYGFFIRWIMKRIARSKGSTDIDTSRDYVYTDWEGVRRFARGFIEGAMPRAQVLAEGVRQG